jgi:hypothetical protein
MPAICYNAASTTAFEECVMSRLRTVPLLALLAFAGAASAETLLIERVQQENKAAMPTRGMTMAQVEARFGTPADRLDPRGGQKHQWPTINRWSYPAFTVYFEKNKVIDAVANKAEETEIGPKPPIR